MEKFFASKITTKAFSEQSGIKVTTLDYWKKRYREKENAKPKGFTPVKITEPPTSHNITIKYADGTHLCLNGPVNAALIKELLAVFSK